MQQQMEVNMRLSEDMSPQQLMEAANNWAKRNNFAPEQLQVIRVLTQCKRVRRDTPSACAHSSPLCASKDRYEPESMAQEFGHLITMVAATYIPRSQITSFRQLDQGSFGMIYSASYDGSSVAVKQCSSVSSESSKE